MQELIQFFSQDGVGTITGITGVTLAVFFHLRSRKSRIIAIKSHNVSMIGGGAVFPDEVEVRYRGTPVPRLTSSTVWIWNAGKKIVEGEDIVESDPLRLCFGGEVLNVSIRKMTREVIHIKAYKSKDDSEEGRGTVYCDFGFLDPRDGGLLEVLHTGSVEAPKCKGTIKKLPKGILKFDGSASSWPERIYMSLGSIVMLILGLIIIGGQVEQVLADQQELNVFFWIGVLLGIFLSSTAVLMLWGLRIDAPSSLDL